MTTEAVVLQPGESVTEMHAKSQTSSHVPALDGIRGIAILCVLLFHLNSILRSETHLTAILSVGWVGVDLFFVLSGFLITRILIATREDGRYYSRFYIRRGLRIWPLYFAYILIMYFGLHLISHIGAVQRFSETSQFLRENPLQLSRPLILYLLLIQNLFGFHDMLGATWSLCIEEHFYLIWPFLVRKLSLASLKKTLWAAFALSPLLRIGYFFFASSRHIPFGAFYNTIYHSTPFHLDSIIAGSLLGLYWVEWEQPALQRARFWYLMIGGFIASALCLFFTQQNAFAACLAYTSLSTLFVGLVGLTLLGWNRRIFVNPQLRYFGKISYGFYLIHFPIIALFQSHPVLHKLFHFRNGVLLEVAGATCAVILSFAVSAASWAWFEKPMLKLKDRLAR
jgi:peptidoglycan/LPS O-acetylase OafA/YrhL